MIEMLYDYNTEYTPKHSSTCYNAHILVNSTGKTWSSLNLSTVYQVSWPNGYDGGFHDPRVVSSSPAVSKIFF